MVRDDFTRPPVLGRPGPASNRNRVGRSFGRTNITLILDQRQFFLVFTAATGAFFFAVLSFQNQERHWPWAAVAALLSPSLLPANVIY